MTLVNGERSDSVTTVIASHEQVLNRIHEMDCSVKLLVMFAAGYEVRDRLLLRFCQSPNV